MKVIYVANLQISVANTHKKNT